MRRIVEVPIDRLRALPPSFSAATAVPLEVPIAYQEGALGVWRCEVNAPGETWAAVYAGPSIHEFWSFLVWRNVEFLGQFCREAVGQHTEDEHARKGLGSLVLEASLQDSLPLVSDRDGMTYWAFRMWHRRALQGGAAILDLETGVTSAPDALKSHELWHDSEGCERLQLVFWPVGWGPCIPTSTCFGTLRRTGAG